MELYSINEVARLIRISPVTVRRLIRARKIPYHRIGSKYLISSDCIQEFLASTRYSILKQEAKNDSK